MRKIRSFIPSLKVRLQLVSTLHGKVIQRYNEPSHTFVRNWFNILFSVMLSFLSTGTTFGAGFLSSKNTSGTVQNTGFLNAQSLIASTAQVDRGLVVGTGTTAESFEAVNLATQCAEGTGANQLNHLAMPATTVAYTSGTKVWAATIKRVMNNNSAAPIVITETGIISFKTGINPFLVIRDLLVTPVTVAIGGQLTVTYIFSLTFPG